LYRREKNPAILAVREIGEFGCPEEKEQRDERLCPIYAIAASMCSLSSTE
jgi:hypothetical protein